MYWISSESSGWARSIIRGSWRHKTVENDKVGVVGPLLAQARSTFIEFDSAGCRRPAMALGGAQVLAISGQTLSWKSFMCLGSSIIRISSVMSVQSGAYRR